MRREEQQRIEEAKRRQFEYRPISSQYPVNRGSVVSDEVTQARHRAEQREAELQQELEIRRIQEERCRALLEFQVRERRYKNNYKLRNGESIQSNNTIY